MSREILFKAKRKDNDEWVEGSLLVLDDGSYRIATSCLVGDVENVLTVCAYDVGSDTVCQYTGLTDKNGNKIWENDILKYSYDYENSPWLISGKDIKYYIGAVFWQEWRGTWAVCAKGKKKGCNQDVFKYCRNPNRTEVIGNIFDNAELLKGE